VTCSTGPRTNPAGGLNRAPWACRRAVNSPTRTQIRGGQPLVHEPAVDPPVEDTDPWLGHAVVPDHGHQVTVLGGHRLREHQVGVPAQRREPGRLGPDHRGGRTADPLDPQHVPPAGPAVHPEGGVEPAHPAAAPRRGDRRGPRLVAGYG
jgi:hypothetical protein